MLASLPYSIPKSLKMLKMVIGSMAFFFLFIDVKSILSKGIQSNETWSCPISIQRREAYLSDTEVRTVLASAYQNTNSLKWRHSFAESILALPYLPNHWFYCMSKPHESFLSALEKICGDHLDKILTNNLNPSSSSFSPLLPSILLACSSPL